MPLNPLIYDFGPLQLRWYGLINLSAVLLATAWVAHRSRRQGLPANQVWNLFYWLLLPALGGARLLYAIQTTPGLLGLDYYLQQPQALFWIWRGGLHGLGALATGAVVLFWLARRAGLPHAQLLDNAAIGAAFARIPIALAGGINQERYGPPTTLPWGLPVSQPYRLGPYTDLQRYPLETLFQPLFLFEALWHLLLLMLLLSLPALLQRPGQPGQAGRPRPAVTLPPGGLCALYLLSWPLERLWLGLLSADLRLDAALLLALAAALLASYVLQRLYRHGGIVELNQSTLHTPRVPRL